MQLNSLTLTTIALSLSLTSFAQVKYEKGATKPIVVKTEAPKPKPQQKQTLQKHKPLPRVDKAQLVIALDWTELNNKPESGQYHGKKDLLITIFKTKQIPADFPLRWGDDEVGYRKEVLNYCAQNPALLETRFIMK